MKTVGKASGVESLKQQLIESRACLVELLGVLDDIDLRQKPMIEMDYAMKVGVWEAECAKANLAARRAKRRYELAQAQANRGREVDFSAIDDALDLELQEWISQVSACVESLQVHFDRRAGMGCLSSEEAHELKMLHRKLVKRLHPDLNPGDPEAERLFSLVRAAYENGDLSFLRALDVATSSKAPDPDDVPDDVESLYLDIELANAQIAFVQERIEQEKASAPYIFKDLLKDEAWVESKVGPLRSQIEELERVRKAYEKRTEGLKGASDVR